MKSPLYRMVVRQLLNHLLFAVLTLIVVFTLSSFFPTEAEDPELAEADAQAAVYVPATLIVPGLLAWLLFAAATYAECWNVGARDINLVKYKHITYMPLKGLFAGLLTQVPGVALALLALLGVLWARTACIIFYLPYIWLFTPIDAAVFPLVLFAPALIQPLFHQWGYRNGYRYFSLYHKIVYKDPHRTRQMERLKR